MMPDSPFAQMIEQLSVDSLWVGVKLIFLVAFILYIGFSVVVVSQMRQMSNTLVGGFEKQLEFFGWLHVGAAILAFIWAFMIL